MNTSLETRDLADELTPAVRVMQIIVLALTLGAGMFAGISVYLQQAGVGMPAGDNDILVAMGVGGAIAALVASQLLPRVVAASLRRSIANGTLKLATPVQPSGAAGKLCAVYQTKLILGAAMLEGAAFFNLVAYMITGSSIALGFAVGLIIVMVSMLPTTGRVAQWIEEQLRLLADERTMNG